MAPAATATVTSAAERFVMRSASVCAAKLDAESVYRVAAARRQTHDCGHAASALGQHRPDRCRAPRWPRWPAAPSRLWATRKSAADFRRRAYIGHGDVPLV